MYSFTAIDFETANPDGNSICQIGLVQIKEGIVAKELSILIQPPRNYYWRQFINVHGITPSATAFSPSFAEVWSSIEEYIVGQNVVAHNASFDINCLRKTLAYYQIEEPPFKSHCTYKIYKKGLAKLCEEHKIKLNHHDALSDANACATLFLKHLQTKNGVF